MTDVALLVLFVLGLGAGLAANAYLVTALIAVVRFRRRVGRSDDDAGLHPPVTVLKPLCGHDYDLLENLRSFCVQDFRVYQIVFGVRSESDPAVAVVERVMAEFPDRDITLVVDAGLVGSNFKVSNLVNMRKAAKHPLLVIADSDMRVEPHYLATIAHAFRDPRVGAVTCLYTGRSSGSFASSLGCMFVNEWFLPSVLVSGLLQDVAFCLGATMSVRGEVLDALGGFESLADVIADDYELGKRVRDLGYKVMLSSYVVANPIHEPSLRTLLARELRWARTIRTVRPGGYRFSFIMNSITVAGIGWGFSDLSLDLEPTEYVVPLTALGLRVVLHYLVNIAFGIRRSGPVWMIPIRDILSFAIWLASYAGRRVTWRNESFDVRPDGRMIANEAWEG